MDYSQTPDSEPLTGLLNQADGEDSFNSQKTEMMELNDGDEECTQLYDEEVSVSDKTICLLDGELQNELTAGWLVCRSGLLRGKSYCMHIGRNFAGRALHSDIPLSDDPQIVRENHFSLVYDPKSRQFFAVQGMGLAYVNNVILKDSVVLQEGDMLAVGSSSYDFVPYCNERRFWDEKK